MPIDAKEIIVIFDSYASFEALTDSGPLEQVSAGLANSVPLDLACGNKLCENLTCQPDFLCRNIMCE